MRRALQALPLLLAVVVLNFCSSQAAPGSFLDVMTAGTGKVTDPAIIDRLRTTFGMDQPAWLQLWRYLQSVLRLNLGYSYRHNRPVVGSSARTCRRRCC